LHAVGEHIFKQLFLCCVAVDVVKLPIKCSIKDVHSEHIFSADKETLTALGFANIEEGQLDVKDLVLLSMHFLVDDMYLVIYFISYFKHIQHQSTTTTTTTTTTMLFNLFFRKYRHVELADIPKELSPAKLHELFPQYRKAVAKPGSPAATGDGSNCTIM
jgi:hypothetical protein